MSFSAKYQNIYNLVKCEIDDVLSEVLAGLDCPCEMKSTLENFFRSPSKHIRALISFLHLKALGEDIDNRQKQFQAIIDLIHNGSLIHDDIIDSSEFRRGEKSINAGFGNHFAVVTGDFILAIALKKIASLNDNRITDMISNTISKMCIGEISQHYSKFKLPTIEEYIEKSYNKTGILFETAICGAELLSKNSISDDTKNFAVNFGIAFQLKNDLKNLKLNSPDGDINNGIYTAAIIFSNNPKDYSSGIEKAESLLDNYLRRAEISVNRLTESIYKKAIIELIGIIRDE